MEGPRRLPLVTVLALNILTPEPKPNQLQTGARDNALDSGNIATLTIFPYKVTHLLLPALLTEWHKRSTGTLQQPNFQDLLKEWEDMVQKIDNTSKMYFNFLDKIGLCDSRIRGIKWNGGKIYLPAITLTKYQEFLRNFYTTHQATAPAPASGKTTNSAKSRPIEPDKTAHVASKSTQNKLLSKNRTNESSFAGMGTYTYPLFLNFFPVKPYSINSRGIQFVLSHNERTDQDL